MARRVLTQAEQAAITFQALTLPAPTRRVQSPEAKSRAAFNKATEQASEMFKTKNFSQAEVKHVVALHGLLHKAILEVEEAELATQFLGAVSSASKLCREEFQDTPELLVEYVRWAWMRERHREHKRRTEGDTKTGRLSWKLLFGSRHLITDYRVAQHRTRAAGAKP